MNKVNLRKTITANLLAGMFFSVLFFLIGMRRRNFCLEATAIKTKCEAESTILIAAFGDFFLYAFLAFIVSMVFVFGMRKLRG